MAKQQVAFEYHDGTSWRDVVAEDKVFADTVTITRGQAAEGSAFRPCTITGQLDNATDKYRVSNPESPLYGLAGRNTPVRVRVADSVRGTAEASSWMCDQTDDFRRTPPRGKAWTDVKAGGLLQRIGQWTEPLRSPLTQYDIDEVDGLAGYWPMEDARGTTKAWTPVTGADNTRLFGVNFASQRRLPGSGPQADVDLAGDPTFVFTGGTVDSVAGWSYSIVTYMTTLGSSFYTPLYVRLRNGYTVSLSLDFTGTDSTVILVSDETGSTVTSATNTVAITFAGRWVMLGLQATESGGTVTINAYYRDMQSATPVTYVPSTTYSGVTSSLDFAQANALPDGSTIGHVIGTVGTTTYLFNNDRLDAALGWPDDTTADRFERLMDLKGLDYTIIGVAADSHPMGPMGVATLADHLKEIITTEDGLIYDDIDDIALVFLLRPARYNQTPALSLHPADFRSLPKEITDDLGTHNLITASQRDGGDYTVEDSTTTMGTQPPPAGVGEAKQTVDVNVADETSQLPQQANWWLKRGTVALPRFPTVTLDLNAMPHLVAGAEAVDVGSVLEIAEMREYTIRLYVLGIKETIGTHTRTIVFTCAPDQQFQTGTYEGDSEYTPRYDLATCTLNGIHSPTATTLTFTLTDDEQWSTVDTYELLISGELIGIPAGVMGARTGSPGAYAQVATGALRSRNGVRKTLPSGAEAHIATPGRWAL